ncbi:DUF2877 domain-containing protein [Mumia sp. zg.B53]|uniref:oxamate carbamoyltransferase subunit AllH family protein n=1 Tax=Mumia sp. zg.B53 TaxID=2855449 RepID=UPI001C6F04EA|nr:DUF2877 domain-containing protein [Mumia sp. zg.B53]MBW9215523.1 DUF2877 domain-containing protein [Mumia sp. zg.B53]
MVEPFGFRSQAAGRPDRHRGAHPSAATPEIAARLHGPRRAAPIVHRGPHAVYVDDRGTRLAVLGRDAVAVPCGVQTPWPDVAGVRSVILGGGRCSVDDRDLRVQRYLDARVRPLSIRWQEHALPTASLATEVDALLRAAVPYAALQEDDPAAVDALLGRGPGLTPLGDDVLAGWLVTRHAAGYRGGRLAQAVLAVASVRTTTVSSTLLLHAARGEGVPQLCALVESLGRPGDADRLADLRLVGHTSGAGLALGAALALPSPSAAAA